MKPCACGCGELITDRDNQNRFHRFKYGHNSKGKGNPKYNNGISNDRSYIIINKPDHRLADKKGFVHEHRLVYEEYYKCSLLPGIVIHHKNGDTKDNRIENLQAMTKRQHALEHRGHQYFRH